MIVIADTSCICYLILLDCIELLSQLYGDVFIPNAVYLELQAEKAPDRVKRWIEDYPSWLRIEFVEVTLDLELKKLDLGETEAIVLAERLQADLLIVDDRFARAVAKKRGLTITGLLGVLYNAALEEKIDLPQRLEALSNTNFHVNPKLLKSLLHTFEQSKNK